MDRCLGRLIRFIGSFGLVQEVIVDGTVPVGLRFNFGWSNFSNAHEE